jgi:hypothetical protein
MKNLTRFAIAAGVSVAAFCAPAQAAVTVVTGQCSSLTVVGNSCLFDGLNLANAADVTAVQNAYNALYNPDLDLSGLLQGTNPGTGFGSISYDDASQKTGDWSTPGYSIQYLAVSGGNKTMLYYLGGVSSGDWSTLGILNNGGQQPMLSHLAFLGTATVPAVPEPASWALVIAGLGIVGASMRRRKTAVSFA